MAIIKPNNNTISAITALPAAITTGKVLQVVQATKQDTQDFALSTGTKTKPEPASLLRS